MLKEVSSAHTSIENNQVLSQSSRTHCRLEIEVAYSKKVEQNYLGEKIIVSDLTYPGQKNFLMTIVITIQITMDDCCCCQEDKVKALICSGI